MKPGNQREGGTDVGMEGREWRKGGREGEKEGVREGGMEGWREGRREGGGRGGRERECEGGGREGREGGRGGREGGRYFISCSSLSLLIYSDNRLLIALQISVYSMSCFHFICRRFSGSCVVTNERLSGICALSLPAGKDYNDR